MHRDRTGLLIIRAWVEIGSTEPLRIQVRVLDDISSGIERSLTLVTSESAGALVEEWLRGMVEAAAPEN